MDIQASGPLYTAPHSNAGRGDGNAAQNHHITPKVSQTEDVAVKSAKEIAAGVAARLQAEKTEELAAAQEGARKLTDLRVALEPLRHDYGALFDDGPAGEERSLWVQQDDRLVAKWTRRGRTLVFQPESTRLPDHDSEPKVKLFVLLTPEEASAFVEYLDQSNRGNATAAAASAKVRVALRTALEK
jgi:hypothetical protein